MATTNPLASLFGRNPFSSLQEHMRAVMACVENVPSLFEAAAAGDQARVAEIAARIDETEGEADRIKNELRLHLPRTIFLPVNRRDLLDILDMQDSMADVAQDIAGLIRERNMIPPEFLRPSLTPFVERCVETCRAAHRIIEELDELLETGFRGREASTVDSMISALGMQEDETDTMGASLARLLFRHEDDLKPVSVMFWYRVLDLTGDLADYAEKTGNRLRLLIAQ